MILWKTGSWPKHAVPEPEITGWFLWVERLFSQIYLPLFPVLRMELGYSAKLCFYLQSTSRAVEGQPAQHFLFGLLFLLPSLPEWDYQPTGIQFIMGEGMTVILCLRCFLSCLPKKAKTCRLLGGGFTATSGALGPCWSWCPLFVWPAFLDGWCPKRGSVSVSTCQWLHYAGSFDFIFTTSTSLIKRNAERELLFHTHMRICTHTYTHSAGLKCRNVIDSWMWPLPTRKYLRLCLKEVQPISVMWRYDSEQRIF